MSLEHRTREEEATSAIAYSCKAETSTLEDALITLRGLRERLLECVDICNEECEGEISSPHSSGKVRNWEQAHADGERFMLLINVTSDKIKIFEWEIARRKNENK